MDLEAWEVVCQVQEEAFLLCSLGLWVQPSANGPDVHAEDKWCKVSAPLMSSVPPGGGQGWGTEAHEGVAKLAFT